MLSRFFAGALTHARQPRVTPRGRVGSSLAAPWRPLVDVGSLRRPHIRTDTTPLRPRFSMDSVRWVTGGGPLESLALVVGLALMVDRSKHLVSRSSFSDLADTSHLGPTDIRTCGCRPLPSRAGSNRGVGTQWGRAGSNVRTPKRFDFDQRPPWRRKTRTGATPRSHPGLSSVSDSAREGSRERCFGRSSRVAPRKKTRPRMRPGKVEGRHRRAPPSN